MAHRYEPQERAKIFNMVKRLDTKTNPKLSPKQMLAILKDEGVRNPRGKTIDDTWLANVLSQVRHKSLPNAKPKRAIITRRRIK